MKDKEAIKILNEFIKRTDKHIKYLQQEIKIFKKLKKQKGG